MGSGAIQPTTAQETEYAVRQETQKANVVLQTIPYAYLRDAVPKDIQTFAVVIAARRTAFAAMGKTAAVTKKRVGAKINLLLKRLLVVKMVSPRQVVTRTFRRVVKAMGVSTPASPSSTPLDVSCLFSHFLLLMLRVDFAHLAEDFFEYYDLTRTLQ